MSTKIGIITEGPIDSALLPPLLSRIAEVRAGFRWPVDADDVAEHFLIRKRGHGGVLEAVRQLVNVLDSQGGVAPFDHDGFVILLDRRTRHVQEEVWKLIRSHDRFVLAIAREEVEAWWLADRDNTLAWCGLKDSLPATCRYAQRDYHAESDDDPKRTLSELTEASDRFDRVYGEGNVDMAREFAENHWREFARLDDMCAQCAEGFGRFDTEMTNLFRRIKAASWFAILLHGHQARESVEHTLHEMISWFDRHVKNAPRKWRR